MTRDTRGTTQYNYTISAAGRLARVAIGTSVRADYVYDGKSRLSSRVTQNQTGAGTVRYVHDNENRIIAELNATGTTLREYVWLEEIPVAVLDGSTNTANPSLFFVHADHLNRPIAMSNASRDWVWRAQYEPFGAVHQIVGPAANDNRFPGQMFQLEAGLAYNWHRHYDATLGRYTQADPLGLTAMLSDGPSVYGYAGQSPLMLIDPFGLFTIFENQGVTFHSYPGPKVGGSEHARQGPGGQYHIHLKDGSGREARVSTETWKPLTPEDARNMTKQMQNACDRLSPGEKGFIDRVNRQVFHNGRPTLKQIERIGNTFSARSGFSRLPRGGLE